MLIVDNYEEGEGNKCSHFNSEKKKTRKNYIQLAMEVTQDMKTGENF